jgi:hypothetical protein
MLDSIRLRLPRPMWILINRVGDVAYGTLRTVGETIGAPYRHIEELAARNTESLDPKFRSFSPRQDMEILAVTYDRTGSVTLGRK